MTRTVQTLAINAKASNGFTLVEVLVAVLVLSVGLLGMAGLQMYSLANTHSAYLRSQATFLAYDIIDRMRANREQAVLGVYDTNFGTAPTGTDNCETSTCTPAGMAVFDRNQWKCTLGAWNSNSVCASTLAGAVGRLPNGDGRVTSNGAIYTVSVRWDDRDVDAGDGATNSVTLQVSTEL